MTVFEYLMVMVSMVLALALAQLLRGATEIFTNPNRYWVHSTWVLVLIFLVIQTWWAFWDWNSLANWDLLSFLFLLSFPIGVFIASYLLIPAYRSAEMDWKAHFYAVKWWLFVTIACVEVIGIGLSWILLGTSLLHPYRIFQSALVITTITAAIASSHTVQAPLVIIYFILLFGSQVFTRMRLGALIATD